MLKENNQRQYAVMLPDAKQCHPKDDSFPITAHPDMLFLLYHIHLEKN